MMTEQELEPEIVAMGTTRVLRIRRIGTTYFVENCQRKIDYVDGQQVVEDIWKVVAVAKPEMAREKRTARQEAFAFLHQANMDVARLMLEDYDKQHAQPR